MQRSSFWNRTRIILIAYCTVLASVAASDQRSREENRLGTVIASYTGMTSPHSYRGSPDLRGERLMNQQGPDELKDILLRV